KAAVRLASRLEMSGVFPVLADAWPAFWLTMLCQGPSDESLGKIVPAYGSLPEVGSLARRPSTATFPTKPLVAPCQLASWLPSAKRKRYFGSTPRSIPPIGPFTHASSGTRPASMVGLFCPG